MNNGQVDELADIMYNQRDPKFTNPFRVLFDRLIQLPTAALNATRHRLDFGTEPLWAELDGCTSNNTCNLHHLWWFITNAGLYMPRFGESKEEDDVGRWTYRCRHVPCREASMPIWVEHRLCIAWYWHRQHFYLEEIFFEIGIQANPVYWPVRIAVWTGDIEFEEVKWSNFIQPFVMRNVEGEDETWKSVSQQPIYDNYKSIHIKNSRQYRRRTCQPALATNQPFRDCHPTHQREVNSYWIFVPSSQYVRSYTQLFQYNAQLAQPTRIQIVPVFGWLDQLKMIGGLVGLTQGFTVWQVIPMIIVGISAVVKKVCGKSASAINDLLLYTISGITSVVIVVWLLVDDIQAAIHPEILNTYELNDLTELSLPDIMLRPDWYAFDLVNVTKLYEYNVSLPLLHYMFVASQMQLYFPGSKQIELRNVTIDKVGTPELYRYVNAFRDVDTLDMLPAIHAEYRQLAARVNVSADQPGEHLLYHFFLDPCLVIVSCELNGQSITKCCHQWQYMNYGDSGMVSTLKWSTNNPNTPGYRFNGSGANHAFRIGINVRAIVDHADMIRYSGKYRDQQLPHFDVNCLDCKPSEYAFYFYFGDPGFTSPQRNAYPGIEGHYIRPNDMVWSGKQLTVKLKAARSRHLSLETKPCHLDPSIVCNQCGQYPFTLRDLVLYRVCACHSCIRMLRHIPALNHTCCTPQQMTSCLMNASLYTNYRAETIIPSAQPYPMLLDNLSGPNLEQAVLLPGRTNFSDLVTQQDLIDVGCSTDIRACEIVEYEVVDYNVVDVDEDVFVLQYYMATPLITGVVEQYRLFTVLELVGMAVCGIGFMFGFCVPVITQSILLLVDAFRSPNKRVMTALLPITAHWQRFEVHEAKHHEEGDSGTKPVTRLIIDRLKIMAAIVNNSSETLEHVNESAGVLRVTEPLENSLENETVTSEFIRSVLAILLIGSMITGATLTAYVWLYETEATELNFDIAIHDHIAVPSILLCSNESAVVANYTTWGYDLENDESDLWTPMVVSGMQCYMLDQSAYRAYVQADHTIIIEMSVKRDESDLAVSLGDPATFVTSQVNFEFEFVTNQSLLLEYELQEWSLLSNCESESLLDLNQLSCNASECAHTTLTSLPPCQRRVFIWSRCDPLLRYIDLGSACRPVPASDYRKLRVSVKNRMVNVFIEQRRYNALSRLIISFGFFDLCFGTSLMSAVFAAAILFASVITRGELTF